MIAKHSSMQAFRRDGYTIIRGLLTSDEAAHYRELICQLSGVRDSDWKTRSFECPDGITKNKQFWPLITNSRLLDVIRDVLGPEYFYTRHSDLHAHRIGGWHRDSACRVFGVGPDWDPAYGDYSVLRVAIYLQSFHESGSKLGVIPGSHLYETVVRNREARYWRWLQRLSGKASDVEIPARVSGKWLRTQKGLPYLKTPSRAVWIPTEPGDCIIFDQRLYHSASKIHGPKYAAYLSYSGNSRHTQNHMRYYLRTRRDLKYGICPEELVDILKQRNLYLDPPTESLIADGVHLPASGDY